MVAVTAGSRRHWAAAAPMALAATMSFAGFAYWRTRYFFRDPVRRIPGGDDKIVSAADGFITYVKRVDAGTVPIAVKNRRSIPLSEYCGLGIDASGYLVGTYMTEHSVHRNRAPISGIVQSREHRCAAPFNHSMARMLANLILDRGPFDRDCEHLLTNERLTIGIRHPSGAVVGVTQIADLWVNRIVARVNVGDTVNRGDQYGMIRFGSQCDVFLPDALVSQILVRPRQYVLAGSTVLALSKSMRSSATPRTHNDACTYVDEVLR
jgi:phosphatidylserine decarboxylase